ncbi:nuclear transport factor 2 family protein [Lacimicrobium alkaliphilum]|uniref:SnoaL-like domain-containing protein n=1 Tax=Lacimicrobium alkaliphilum TaxID=1526571 RepID=A0ABQ1R8G7_9ALTE|nr:nuclear transport factor 2 family protein [Lacimicrobium alkaliphilum]GGD58434.1 hypothetical protein GCM10011357_12160 [Lacimicrobium alkaliphilum]
MTQPTTSEVLHWQTINGLLHPTRPKNQALVGFDHEFVDIADFILRITHRIWEQKNIGLCYDYYEDHCPVHTLGAYCDSVETVVQNTLRTIASFPDRSLIGENVIWSEEPDEVYYSSHRITSIMTNQGPSEFGPPTYKTGRVTTIADCLCKDNKIYYEWLMRDNSFLVKQLGIDPVDAAMFQAQQQPGQIFNHWLKSEYQRTRDGQAMACDTRNTDTQWAEFADGWAEQIFNHKCLNRLSDFYHPCAQVQWPGGRQATGLAAISGLLTQWLATCPDARMVIDHIAVVPFDENRSHVALRWGVSGSYQARDSRLKACNGHPYYVLGATHFELSDGQILQEWTVFDEVAAIANLLRHQSKRSED